MTSEMEKAMYLSHGVGYNEYSRCLDARMRVEKRRERSYIQSHEVLNEYNRRVFK
ncbi:hypothetical protein [Bacillus massilioanorexius]|uniref:hypothetical protein n=2 Tax=Bacillus TaxID=1386 RepID=UPI003CCC7255